MAYQVQVFRNLLTQYTTWESLEAYLTSPEGGQLRCVSVGDGRYKILRYTKGISDLKVPHVKWFRSVLWDSQQHLPVCVAPPKAEKGDVESGTSYPLVQQFLDGIMINAFRTVEAPMTLQVATRTQLGAAGKFYSEKTFAELFQDALNTMGYTQQDILNLLAQPTEMVPNHFVSFVLQHPDHRVVARCSSPRLWIAHVGAIQDDGTVSMNEDPEHWPARLRLPAYSAMTGKDLETFFPEECTNRGWFFQGLTIKDGKGSRWRLRNPNYLYLRTLRGSEATTVERFLRLRSESKVSEYLKHYSEERQLFWDLEQKLRAKTQEVYQGYCDVHKAHTKKLEDLEFAVKPCVFKLHAHYLEHLRPNNEKVLMKHAVELVNNLALYEQKRLLSSTTSGSATSGLA